MRLIHSLLPRVLLSASSTAEQWQEALSPFNVDEAGVPARLDYRVILLLPCPVLCAQVCMYHWVHVHRRKTSVSASLLTPGDPMVDPSRIAALGRFLASRAIPAPHSPSSLVSRLSTWRSRDPSGELGPTLTASLILQPIPSRLTRSGSPSSGAASRVPSRPGLPHLRRQECSRLPTCEFAISTI